MYLGTFEVKAEKVIISDPCYTRDTWCSGSLEVPNGTWEAYTEESEEGSWGLRTKSLTAKLKDTKNLPWEITNIHVGVDSGQAGIFCDSIYPEEDTGDYHDMSSFYGKICAIDAHNGYRGGVIEGGCKSTSGFGDGGYSCFVQKDEDKIVGIKIVFIPDEEEE
jgi:hypothetical protein